MAHTWHWSTWDKGEPNPSRHVRGHALGGSTASRTARTARELPQAVVTLSVVKFHNGVRYYSRMTWYTPGYRMCPYKTSTAVLHFSVPPGASVPGWH